MNCAELIFSAHAVQRLFERDLTPEQVQFAVAHSEIIADYPDDKPYPSCLILGFVEQRPLHVVVAADSGKCYVVTAYIPDPRLWQDDFKTRRTPCNA